MADIKKILLFAAAIAFSIMIWSVLLGFSGIMEADLLSFKAWETVPGILLSPFTIGFALLLPLTFGIVSGLSHTQDKIDVLAGASIGAFIGWMMYLLMFGFALKTVLVSILIIPAIALTGAFSYFRKAEFKSLVGFRTGAESAKKGFLAFSIGIFVVLSILGMPNNDGYAREFFDTIVDKTTASMLGKSDIAEAGADQALSIQRMLMVSIMGTEQFKKMRQKTDPDVQVFVATMDATSAAIDSPETKKKIVDELAKSNAALKEKIGFDSLKKTSKEIEVMAAFYSPLVAFGVVTTFAAYLNLIAANIAGVYAAVLKLIIEAIKGAKKSGKEGG